MHKVLSLSSQLLQHQLTIHPGPSNHIPPPPPITPILLQIPWLSRARAVAAPAKLVKPASALPKPSAPAATSLLSSAAARRPRPRTRFLVRDALAVSRLASPIHTRCSCGELILSNNSTAPHAAFSIRGLECHDPDRSDSIGARPAGQCTCERAKDENAKLTGSTCACGARPASESILNALSPLIPHSPLSPHATRSNTRQTPVAAKRPPTAAYSQPRPTSPPRPLVLKRT